MFHSRSLHALLALFAVSTACGARPADRPGSEATRPPAPIDVTQPEEEPEEARTAAPRVVASAAPDLLRCDLQVDAHELGEAGDGVPSAPAALGDGFVVAFTRTTAAGTDLLAQRLGGDGRLAPAVVVRRGVHASRPFVIGEGTSASVLAITQDGATEVIALDPATGGASDATPQVFLLPPEDVALGPRGLVRVFRRGDRRVVARDGRPDVALPAPESVSVPREPILASGAASDLVVVRQGRAVRTAILTGTSTRRSEVLFRGGAGRWAELGVAAGPGGFVLVRTGPEIGDLEVYLGDAGGSLGAAVGIGPPATSTLPPDALVRRYPRAAALGDGWALSYWDGTGPSLVRVDASGHVTADAIELRSGDERGGHTDARMVATERAIAVTWQVEPPRMGHGFPEEEPRRPGPRLAILRCAD